MSFHKTQADTTNQTQSHQSGLTLIELIAVLALSGILLSLATPGMHSLMMRFERDTITSKIRQGVSAARQIAILGRRTITVCGINQENSCTNRDFETLVIFEDTNRSGTWETEEKRYRYLELDHSGQLWMTASLGRTYIRFGENGRAKQAGSFIYCNPLNASLATRVTVSIPGRTYTAVDLDNDGVIETASGDAISC